MFQDKWGKAWQELHVQQIIYPLRRVKSRLPNDPRPWCRQRWLGIYNALVDLRKAEEIAKHCGVSKSTVHQVISLYNRSGEIATAAEIQRASARASGTRGR